MGSKRVRHNLLTKPTPLPSRLIKNKYITSIRNERGDTIPRANIKNVIKENHELHYAKKLNWNEIDKFMEDTNYKT